jgi:putative transposase
MSTEVNTQKCRSYPSDMSTNGWQQLKKLIKFSAPSPQGGRPASDFKEVVNAIFYVVKTGCSWRCLPHDFPCWQTAYGYFNAWSKDGSWEWIHACLIKKIRKKAGRKARPSAGVLDSQSSETSLMGGSHRGYDAAKKVKGRKRFILTDTQGLILGVWICAASLSEKTGAMQLLRYIKKVPYLKDLCRRIELVWVDGGYRGDDLLNYVWSLWRWCWLVVQKSREKGFKVLPRRWVVERTFAWLLNARRLTRDYEYNRRNSQSMVYIAMIALMAKRF